MIIGGLHKFSLLDYPEKVSAIVFTQGCNFRCQFCYNPMLVWPKGIGCKDTFSQEKEQEGHPLTEGDLFEFLKTRIGKLDAVVITGGEPTLHNDLPEFIKKIKDLGFLVKLDTNGTNPEMIKKLLEQKLIDYIAMDIKATPEKYDLVTGVQTNLSKIKESIIIIMKSGLPYEFRSTITPGLIKKTDIEGMGKMIEGANKWFLQQFKNDTDLVNPDTQKTVPYSSLDFEEMQKEGSRYAKFCGIR